MDAADNPDQPGPLRLSSNETELLYRTTCRLVEAAAHQAPTTIREYDLGRLPKCPLVGVFVTLRKNGELRACIGNFATDMVLGSALERAAWGAVNHDPRFPPVTPDELPDLTITVSLLHTRELIEGSAEERVKQVVIGQHGLDIQYRGCKGLLLPNVAVDLGLDAVGFLEAVCRKANLPPDAWRNPEATLYRFSAVAFGGPWIPAE
ncbi:MAG: AmmeMemoRadiSam system protein A [Planctomycetota bacterium]